MSSVNKVIVLGRLGRDPDTRYMPSGEAVTNLSIATSENWKDKNTGEAKQQTEWHRVNLFGKQAEIAHKYLGKGSLCYVEGRLTTRKWTDKDGVERFSTEIKGDQLRLLDKAEPASTIRDTPTTPQPKKQEEEVTADDDIPF